MIGRIAIINNIAEISQTLKTFTASVDKLVEANKGNIDSSLQNLKEITDKVKMYGGY